MGQPVLHPWGRALPRGENVARGTSLATRLPKSRGEVEAAEELGWTRLPSAGLLPCPPFAHPCSRERFAAQRTEPKIPLLRPCYCPRRSPGLPTLTTLIQENSPGGPGALGGTEGGFTWTCFCTNLSHR